MGLFLVPIQDFFMLCPPPRLNDNPKKKETYVGKKTKEFLKKFLKFLEKKTTTSPHFPPFLAVPPPWKKKNWEKIGLFPPTQKNRTQKKRKN